jgi:hypothetical protein
LGRRCEDILGMLSLSAGSLSSSAGANSLCTASFLPYTRNISACVLCSVVQTLVTARHIERTGFPSEKEPRVETGTIRPI